MEARDIAMLLVNLWVMPLQMGLRSKCCSATVMVITSGVWVHGWVGATRSKLI